VSLTRHQVPGFLPDDPEEAALAGPGRVIPSGPAAEGPLEMATDYLGLELRSPLVASASPLTGHLDGLAALAAAGVGAVVLPSLFEEQISHEAASTQDLARRDAEASPEAIGGYTPALDDYNSGARRYVKLVRDAKATVDVPVIASLNGVTRGGWTRYAAMLAEAGADAIELNIYRVAADIDMTGRQVETETLELVAAVRAASPIPIAVKVGPYYSAFANMARRLADAGADGLVLFNRFYQPDIDVDLMRVEPHLVLSDSEELRLPLRWCAILHGRIDASLALTTGVHTGTDVVKGLLAGADVVMATSSLLRHGPEHAGVLLDHLRAWLEIRGYASVREMVGAVSQAKVREPAEFERANYLATLTHYAGQRKGW
jgi:dihydroorotate dehydrogenase (fumarate)